jgi:hypothetical protein
LSVSSERDISGEVAKVVRLMIGTDCHEGARMTGNQGSFLHYRRRTAIENFLQFKGKNYRDQTFAIAAASESVLNRALACPTAKLGDYSKSDCVVVTRPSGHQELWVSPRFRKHRAAQFVFFEKLGLYVPKSMVKDDDSDHAYPISAAGPDVGLIRMHLIDSGANRSFGSGWEKRFTHRTLDDDGLCLGNLFDLHKSIGGRLFSPTDPVASLIAAADHLISIGIAPLQDRPQLLETGKSTIAYKQTQDENYAIETGQIDLTPGMPLIPKQSGPSGGKQFT